MKKIVLFVLLEPYADWEGAYLCSWLLDLNPEEYAVKTVSLSREPVRSMGGFTTLPDYTVNSAPTNFEALILIGGMSWRTEAARQTAPLVSAALRGGKVLGGICDAAGFLGALGALNKVRHTVNDLEDLKQWAGKAYTGEALFLPRQAVRDGNIVTANGTAPLEFAREVLLALGAAPEPRILEEYRFDKLGYYEAIKETPQPTPLTASPPGGGASPARPDRSGGSAPAGR